MQRPVIGITANVSIPEAGILPETEKLSVNNDYIKAISLAGGLPIILPVATSDDQILHQADVVDGIILAGGYDIDPMLYGEEPDTGLGYICPERDLYEIKLTHAVYAADKSILGICRGIQVLNVAFGGTLYQDLPSLAGPVSHMQKASPGVPFHTITMASDSQLYGIFGSSARTNSFHHQSVKEAAPGFRITAWAKDGVIEGIENKNERFVLGVQWHPEKMIAYPAMRLLFKRFVAVSARAVRC